MKVLKPRAEKKGERDRVRKRVRVERGRERGRKRGGEGIKNCVCQHCVCLMHSAVRVCVHACSWQLPYDSAAGDVMLT